MMNGRRTYGLIKTHHSDTFMGNSQVETDAELTNC